MTSVIDFLDDKVNAKRKASTEAAKSRKRPISVEQLSQNAKRNSNYKKLREIDIFLDKEAKEEKDKEDKEEYIPGSFYSPTVKSGRKKLEPHIQKEQLKEEVSAIVKRIYKSFTKIPQSLLLKKCGILQLSSRNILENKVKADILKLVDVEGIVLISLEEDNHLVTVQRWMEHSGIFL